MITLSQPGQHRFPSISKASIYFVPEKLVSATDAEELNLSEQFCKTQSIIEKEKIYKIHCRRFISRNVKNVKDGYHFVNQGNLFF